MSFTLVRVGPVRIRSSERVEQRVAIMGIEHRTRVHAGGASARQRVGRDEGARRVLRPIDAIGVPGGGPDAGRPLQRDRERQQELGVAPAAPGRTSADRHRRLPARQQHGRGGQGSGVRPHRTGDAGHQGASLPRLALQRVAEDQR